MRAPPKRRRFVDEHDELRYLRQQLLYWLYEKKDVSHSASFARRVEEIWDSDPRLLWSVVGNECMALASEALGKTEASVTFRRKHIASIACVREYARSGLPFDQRRRLEEPDWYCTAWDLASAYDLLAVALWNDEKLPEALDALEESKRICKAFKLKFDARDVERDIRAELAATRRAQQSKPTKPVRRKRRGGAARLSNSAKD